MSVTKEELERYQRADAEGHPLISDEEYDRLMEAYVQENGESKRPFNRQKQSADVNEIVGTLTKRYGVLKAMRPNQKPYKEWVEKQGTPCQTVVVQPKFDGCSVALDFKSGRFFTRGDVDDAESMEVTDLFQHRINDFHKLPGTTSMKFEAIISAETFMRERLYNFYKTRRAAAQGIMNSHDKERAKFIDLVPLRAYVNGKTYLPEFMGFFTTSMDDYNGIQSFISQLLGDCATIELDGSTYAVDGVVVSVVTTPDPKDAPIFVDPEREVAIKILELTDTTKLISIDFQFGKQGRITPVAIFEPVEFEGISVDHATLSTIERVVQMNLRHGDTIKVMYNIVPYFIDSSHDGDYPIPVPQKCPICGAQLDYSSHKLVRCTNVNCRGLRLGAIIRFAEKMKMVGVSTGNITRLYDAGIVQTIPDLLRLEPNKFMHLSGFGQTSAMNIVESIQKSSWQVRPDRVLGALPINDTSDKTWKCILDALGPRRMELFDWIRDDTFVDNLMSIGYIKNVGEAKIRRIIDGYIRHKDEIQETLSLVTLLEDAPGFRGRICMTGTRDKVVTERLTAEGYDVGGFTNDCIAVIVPNLDYVSAKTEKAKQLGIPIISIEDAPEHFYKPF